MTDTQQLTLNFNAKNHLLTVTRWAKFLAIIGFIGTGFMALASLFILVFSSFIPNIGQMGSASPALMPIKFIGFIYMGFAVFYFFIAYYMYTFASKSANAITLNLDSELEAAFNAMKKQYTLMGIFTIVMLALMLIVMAVGIITAIATLSMI